MKFLFMIFHDENILDSMPEGEMQTLVDSALGYDDEIRRSGHFVGAAPLDRIETATTVRVRHGRPATTDGPFAETKEQLGGYYLIEARDQEEAVRIAGRIPGARHGSVEVRRLLAHDPRVPWDRWRSGPRG